MTEWTIRRRRKKTAAETAKALGVSVRTVQRHVAEARDDYEATAAQRRETAGTMRAAGHSWEEIAKAVGGSEWSARSLVRRYRIEQEQQQQPILGEGKEAEKRLRP